MPNLPDTSDAYKRFALQKNGLSPDEYDLSDDGIPTPKVIEQPGINAGLSPVDDSQSPVAAKPAPTTSVGGTLLHSALNSAIPTGVGLGAAAGGVAATPWIAGSLGLAPETGGASLLGLLVPLLAGAAGGYAGSKLQQPLLSDSFKQQTAQEEQEHPIAATIGNLAPSALAFNPLEGLANLPTTAKAAAKLALGRVGTTGLTDVEQGLLRNAGVNAGIQGGTDVAQQLMSGQPFSVPQALINTAAGGIMNEPWGVGKMLFPHPQTPVEAKPNVANESVGNPTVTPEDLAVQSANQKLKAKDANENLDFTQPGLGDDKKSLEDSVSGLEQQRAKLQKTADDVNDLVGRRADALQQIDDLKKQIDLAKGTLNVQKAPEPLIDTSQANTPAEGDRQGDNLKGVQGSTGGAYSSVIPAETSVEKAMNKQTRYQEEPNEELKGILTGGIPDDEESNKVFLQHLLDKGYSKSTANQIVNDSNIRMDFLSKLRAKEVDRIKQRLAAFNGNPQEYQGLKARLKELGKQRGQERSGNAEVGEFYIGPKYQEEPTTKEPIETATDNDPYLLRNSSNAYKQQVYQLAARRGITLREAMGLTKPDTGKEVLGAYTPDIREATVNPNRAELDTPIHEVTHGFVDDLLNSERPADRELGKRALNIFGGDRNQAEEALVGKLGVKGVPRVEEQLHGSALRNFNSWFGDYKSRMKLNLGMGSDEDVIRHLSARTFYDAPYGTRNELLKYTGFQPGFAGREGGRLYMANEDIKDADGKLLLKKGSTMSEHTLQKLGVKYQDEPTKTYKDLSPEEKKAYGKLHMDALDARSSHEKLPSDESSNNLMDKELALNKFEEEKFPTMSEKYQSEPSKELKMGLPEVPERFKGNDHKEEHIQLPITRSANDTVLKKDGPRAKPFISAITDNANQRSETISRYRKQYEDAVGDLNKEQRDKLENLLTRESRDNTFHVDELTDPKEIEAYHGLRNFIRQMQEDRIEANQPVKSYDASGKPIVREAGIDPYYWPNQMNPQVIAELHKGDTPQAQHLREVWNKHQIANGSSDKQSNEALDAILGSYSKVAPNLAHFRGVDVEQGSGLPQEFMRPGLDRNMDRYINRFSSARAYHDTIESRPEVASLIGEKNTPWVEPLPEKYQNVKPLASQEARDIVKRLKGQDYNPEEGKLHALERVAAAAILGPKTNVHILGSTVANSIGMAKPSEAPGMIMHMVTDFSKAAKHAQEMGNIQARHKIFSGLFDAHATQVERLNIIADGIGRLNGRGITDYVAKTLAQAGGEYLVRARIPLAQTGNKQAIRFMKEVDKNWSPDKNYSEEDITRLGSNFSNFLHGVHDSRTQPAWMLKDNIIQPFTSLMSWNIAQTNTFMKHVITPAVKDGNFAPLITTTLGAVLGGYVIKQAREAISNKKSPIPSFQEIANSSKGLEGNIPLDVYNLLGMTSYAGYGGILSLGARSIFDLKYKNPPQGAVFPLDEVLTGGTMTLAHAASALMASHDINETMRIATKAGADLFNNNVQMANIALSWADQEGLTGDERNRAKKLNTEEADLRRYKEVEGLPYSEQGTDSANPYLNMNRKQYLHEQDIGKAADKLPNLIQQAIDDSQGNIEILRNKLTALKDSEWPSMPSMENAPRQFWNYYSYLEKTKGPEVASARLQEYIKNNMINRVKSDLVPSF